MKEVCRETLTKAYLFLDGEVLSASERHTIEIHLEECAPCLERYGLQSDIVAMLRRRLATPTPCPDGLKSKIAELLQNSP